MPFGGLLLGSIAGNAIGGIGSYLGASEAADAQRRAADLQLQGTREGLAQQQRMFDLGRADLAPFREMDLNARQKYMGLLGGMGSADNPYYQRLWDQTSTNINASLAKQGLLGSGTAATQLSQAATSLQQQREQLMFDRLSRLFGNTAGQQAQLAGQAGQGMAGTIGRGYGAAGEAMGQAGMYGGMATSGLYGSIGGGIAQAGQGYTYGSLMGGRPGAGGWTPGQSAWDTGSTGLAGVDRPITP